MSEPKEIKLKPCPFCQGRDLDRVFTTGTSGCFVYIQCCGCQAGGPGANYRRSKDPDRLAMVKWNRRGKR